MLLYDMQKTGGKNTDTIKAIASMIPQANQTKLSDTAIKVVNDYHAALSNLNNLEESLKTSSVGVGPITGRINAANPWNESAQTLPVPDRYCTSNSW